ncbi:hypothetical protein SEA_GENAMY16_54 [Gordonia phage Genamy16]|uniref:Uncharacterized protein n=2 Tax=Lambovirus TaxID=2843412 RepID=A0A9E7Q3B0_9CAUD|nr:hypothetical protein SEA_GENAMY16_54 [Gordonia phage Genamy16]UVF61758.1 hypothetical protein SEA_NOVASHARKS_53 [Gordonia phage NovaSharks]UVK63135.1 hypothetical protein SEA_RUMI_52 [Gordonia phage Rumi]WNM65358.1 hypothetical protein SEA_ALYSSAMIRACLE_54 [Gordonia phage Alyssamiracle]
MTTKKRNGGDVWYIGRQEAGKMTGFTQTEELALKTENGTPVLAPGDVRRVWEAEYSRIKARRERIWEMLLDTMEEKYELAEKSGTTPDDHKIVDARIDAFQCALAVLELPFGKYDEDPTAAIQTIENKASQRYEAEAE